MISSSPTPKHAWSTTREIIATCWPVSHHPMVKYCEWNFDKWWCGRSPSNNKILFILTMSWESFFWLKFISTCRDLVNSMRKYAWGNEAGEVGSYQLKINVDEQLYHWLFMEESGWEHWIQKWKVLKWQRERNRWSFEV